MQAADWWRVVNRWLVIVLSGALACDQASGRTTCDADVLLERPVDCAIIECEIVDGHASCSFALWLPEGSDGQIRIRIPGLAGGPHWHEAPWYLDAGKFDDPFLAGEGLECGRFELDLTANWQGELELSCTRYGEGGGVAIDSWSP